MSLKNPFQRILIALIMAAAVLAGAVRIEAKTLEFMALTPDRIQRINEEARKYYGQTLAEIDKINYEAAMETMVKAVEAEPLDVYLREAAVSLAVYMGDTRRGAESIRYYEIAATNLHALATSERLNKREQERAQKLESIVNDLRKAVGERDEKRMQHGREIAKKYARIIYKGETEEAPIEKAAKSRVKTPEKKQETPPPANPQTP